MSVRKRSIMQLGLACNFDEEHAHTVSRLALELFDSIQALGIYEFEESERELLEYGATLHDIGTFSHTYPSGTCLSPYKREQPALVSSLKKSKSLQILPISTEKTLLKRNTPTLKG